MRPLVSFGVLFSPFIPFSFALGVKIEFLLPRHEEISQNGEYKLIIATEGLAAGDTPENKVLVAFTKTLAAGKGIKLYVDWHSYGQYILTPYGYSCSAQPANQARQSTLSKGLATKIAASYGTKFTVGGGCAALYATTGDSTDYITDVSKAEFAWTIELRPSSSASNGFVLAASQILPTAIEQWQGMLYLLPTM